MFHAMAAAKPQEYLANQTLAYSPFTKIGPNFAIPIYYDLRIVSAALALHLKGTSAAQFASYASSKVLGAEA